MMKAAVETMLRSAYDARMRGDVAGIMSHFGEGASFSIAGNASASPIPAAVIGQAAIQESMRRLVSAFEFKNAKIVDIIVEGESAAVHWHVHIRALTTGREAETDIVDLIKVKDGKIVSFRQFADTALVAQLLSP